MKRSVLVSVTLVVALSVAAQVAANAPPSAPGVNGPAAAVGVALLASGALMYRARTGR